MPIFYTDTYFDDYGRPVQVHATQVRDRWAATVVRLRWSASPVRLRWSATEARVHQ